MMPDAEKIIKRGSKSLELCTYSLGEAVCMTFKTKGGTTKAFDDLLHSLVYLLDNKLPGSVELFGGLVSVIETIKQERPELAAIVRAGVIDYIKNRRP